MNDIDKILRLLKNSGFHVLGTDGTFIHLEDPSCIIRSFETFIGYAWIAITAITAVLLFGWAISMIRGAKYDSIFLNMRNLLIIFGTLTLVRPIVNLIYGGDLFAIGCKTITVPISEIKKISAMRDSKLAKHNKDDLYEEFDIYDSGALIDAADQYRAANEIPYSISPVAGAGDLESIPVSITGNRGIAANSYKNSISPAASGVTESGNDVIYTNPDGSKYKKSGGYRAWRNNNPGNIRYSEFARRNGAIGSAGGFAVFPDEYTGQNAIKALLQTGSYKNLTVGNAIARWAPPSENNTSGYQRRVESLTGLSINTPMSQLNDTQLESVANAIRSVEGWKPGRTINL